MQALKTTTLFLITALASSCVSYEREQNLISGSMTDQSVLQHITPGVTTSDWWLIHAGEPDRVEDTGNGEQLWTYSSVTQSQTKVRALPLVAVKLQDEQQTLYRFSVQDSVVTRMSQQRLGF